MNVLVVGLGSMGKRRIRCLHKLGVKNIWGYDTREDRCKDAMKTYGIKITNQNIEDNIQKNEIETLIISTPPDKHSIYAEIAYENEINAFIEASVTGRKKIEELNKKMKGKNFKILPSCTMKFFPEVKKIKETIESGIIGDTVYFNYVTGQYLPDWHPWENIKDFYVSNKETGGARELVPFELTWLNDIFGWPKVICSVVKKLGTLNVNIDDYYNFCLEYNNVIGQITVDVIARPNSIRTLEVIGSKGRIHYNGEEKMLVIRNIDNAEAKRVKINHENIEEDYINPEDPYVEELKKFMQAIRRPDEQIFPSCLDDDAKILLLLEEIEKING